MKLAPILLGLLAVSTAAEAGSISSIYQSFPKRRQEAPVVAYQTSRGVEDTRDCLVESMADYKALGTPAGMTNVVPIRDGWLVQPAGGVAGWFADITPSPQGAEVKVWAAGRVPGKLRARFSACAV